MSISSQSNSKSNYRWYILVLGVLTHSMVVSMPRMASPVLFKEISTDLGLSLAQIGSVWGMTSVAGIFLALIGGLLTDKFGVKRTLTIACIAAGVCGALRGLSNSFLSLSITMFLIGIMATIIPNTVHKTAGVWFAGKRLGLANAILSIGMTMGSMAASMISATILSPLLHGWRNVFLSMVFRQSLSVCSGSSLGENLTNKNPRVRLLMVCRCARR